MKTQQISRATIEVSQGDITALAVDAIVNAANIHLQHGGGVAGAISRKGGPSIQEESDAVIRERGSPLATGDAVITGAGRLPCRHVIHTAGPVWDEHSPIEADRLLRRAIRNSLELANANGVTTIAFPAISTGIYGFPLERAAPLMVNEVREFLSTNDGMQRVIFCLFDARAREVFESVLR